jgi:hypothetical protein
VQRPRHWYGAQTLVVDGIADVLLVTSLATDNVPTAVAGGLIYGWGPPVVHFAHRHAGRGFGSFGIRVALPLVGALISTSAASGCSRTEDCWDRTVNIGLGAGFLSAAAIDAAFLAWEPQPSRYARASGAGIGLTLSPTVNVASTLLGFDLRGSW